MSEDKEAEDRVLILCVDRDDDIGQKTGVSTPIVGRLQVLQAATRLATGGPWESIESDRKLLREIAQVASEFKPTETVVVTDGFGDEDIVPVVSSKLPLTSIRRVVVKHSRSVEESYIILGRYIKMLVTDPRFKKWFLGVPGIALVLLALAPSWALPVFLAIIGVAAVIRGFDIDKMVLSQVRKFATSTLPAPIFVIEVFSTISAVTLILVGGYIGAFRIWILYPTKVISMATIMANLSLLLGEWIRQSIDAMAVGFMVFAIGKLVPAAYQKSEDAWRSMLGIVLIVSLYYLVGSIAAALISVDANTLTNLIEASIRAVLTLLVAGLSVYAIRWVAFSRGMKARKVEHEVRQPSRD